MAAMWRETSRLNAECEKSEESWVHESIELNRNLQQLPIE